MEIKGRCYSKRCRLETSEILISKHTPKKLNRASLNSYVKQQQKNGTQIVKRT